VTATEPTIADPQIAFLEHLPRFHAHARYAFRHVRCPDTRADLTAETLAPAWRHFAALALRGRRPDTFVTTLALRCSQPAPAGRCGGPGGAGPAAGWPGQTAVPMRSPPSPGPGTGLPPGRWGIPHR